MMMDRYKAAAIQISIEQGNKEKNIASALKWIDLASEEGAKIACLPEYFSTGYPGKDIPGVAEPIHGPTIETLMKKALEKKIFIIAGSIVEAAGKHFYNASVLIDGRGKVIGTYRKTHPWRGAPKDEYGEGIVPGQDYPVFDTELGKLCVLLDADMDFPEPARIMALDGAEVLFWPCHCSGKWIDSHRFDMQQRAFENMVYVVAPNRVGLWRGTPIGDVIFLGSSRVISPMGEIMSSAGEFSDGAAIGTIDLSGLRQMKKEFNMLHWRQPHTYKRLVES
jgi:predicted amidohydrolase